MSDVSIEYEAMFLAVDPHQIRNRLHQLGVSCEKPEFLQKRVTFTVPGDGTQAWHYLRVRDEWDQVTMSYKYFDHAVADISSQKEVELVIDDFDTGVLFLRTIGATQKAYQETKRELWIFDWVSIMIDWRPFLDPVLEIEWTHEYEVKRVVEMLWFERDSAVFDSIDAVYSSVYDLPRSIINEWTPILTFSMKNPFL